MPGQPLELPVRLPAQANVRAAEPSGAAVPFARLRETLEETTGARIVTLRLAPVERQRVVVLGPRTRRDRPASCRASSDQSTSTSSERGSRASSISPATRRRASPWTCPKAGSTGSRRLGGSRPGGDHDVLHPEPVQGRGERPGRERPAADLSAGRALPRDGVGVGVERPLGLLARPAPLIEGDRLLPEGTVRASLEAGAAWCSRSRSRRAESIASTCSVSGGRSWPGSRMPRAGRSPSPASFRSCSGGSSRGATASWCCRSRWTRA